MAELRGRRERSSSESSSGQELSGGSKTSEDALSRRSGRAGDAGASSGSGASGSCSGSLSSDSDPDNSSSSGSSSTSSSSFSSTSSSSPASFSTSSSTSSSSSRSLSTDETSGSSDRGVVRLNYRGGAANMNSFAPVDFDERPSSDERKITRSDRAVWHEQFEEMSPSGTSEDIPTEELDLSVGLGEKKSRDRVHQTVGCVWCVLALLTILCFALLPLICHECGDLSAEQGRILVDSILGFVALSMFCCVFCTYYVRPVESWEHYEAIGFKRTPSNFAAALLLCVEFLQVLSFSFNRARASFAGVPVRWLNVFAVPVGPPMPPESFFPVYFVMIALAFMPYLSIVTSRVVLFRTHNQGQIEKVEKRSRTLLWFFVNAMMIPVIGTCMFAFDCAWTVEDGPITLEANPDIVCFSGPHWLIMVAAFAALAAFYPSGSFAATFPALTVFKNRPLLQFSLLQVKFVMLIFSFVREFFLFYYTAILLGNIILLLINHFGQPTRIKWVNDARSTLFLLCLTATIFAGFISTVILGEEGNVAEDSNPSENRTKESDEGETNVIPGILMLLAWAIELLAVFLWTKFRRT